FCRLLLLDPSWGLLLVVVLATLFIGAARSLSFLVVQTQQQSPEVREANELKIYMAVLLPVIGSAMLVVLFYFLDQLSVLLVGLFTLSAFVSVTYALSPLCAIIVRWTRLAPEYKVLWFWSERFPTSSLMGMPVALALVVAWLFTRYWLLTDVLALCLGVTAMAFLRLPNLMIASVVLWLFFFYDIFWVFLSAQFFGKNVMVHVATSLPSLPIILIIPRMFLKGYSLLGMGDIILPGLYLAFLYRFDYSRHQWTSWAFTGYFRVGLISYALGFVWTYVMLILLQIAQPALLYLVPSIMVPTVVMALIKKEFMLLWRGSASPVTIGRAAEERELEDLEAGTSKKSRSEVYEPVGAYPDSDEGRVSTAVKYTIDDESDDDAHHTQ
ncbi:signal peptide peptidase, partial [Acanthamoeba castellanii str. Neff]